MVFKFSPTFLLSEIIFFVKRFIGVFLYPYKTFRNIYLESSVSEFVFVAFAIAVYYLFTDHLRSNNYEPFILFAVTVLQLLLTVCFFLFFKLILNRDYELKTVSAINLFTYSLAPTLIWFYLNSALYKFLPPPRTESILGISFSIFFITITLILLFYKIILLYLAVRYTTGCNFFTIIYLISLYMILILPYILALYIFNFFKIPIL